MLHIEGVDVVSSFNIAYQICICVEINIPVYFILLLWSSYSEVMGLQLGVYPQIIFVIIQLAMVRFTITHATWTWTAKLFFSPLPVYIPSMQSHRIY